MYKKTWKRTTALTLAVCMGAFLSGCGQKEAAPKETASNETRKEAEAESQDASEPVNLVWYTPAQQVPVDMELVNEEVNKYLLDKINATVDITMMSYADYNEKMPVIINSGEAFDICFTSTTDNPYVANVARGAFVDLTPYLQKEGKEMYEAIDDRFWNAITISEKIYGVPSQKELPWASTLQFSKEVVEKAGIELPEKFNSLEELEPYLAKMKEAAPDVKSLGLDKKGMMPLFVSNYDMHIGNTVPVGTELSGDDVYKVKNLMTTEEAKAFCKTMQEFYQKGYVPADSTTSPKKIRPACVEYGNYQPYAEQIWERNWGYPVQSVPVAKTIATTSSAMGSMHAVSITSQNPGKAVEFLNLMNTDAYLKNLLTYGIEGVHYEKTGDTSIKLLEKSKDYLIPSYTMGNHFIGYTTDPDPVDKWEEFQAFNDEAEIAPLFGFSFDGESVKNELAAVKNVSQQYYSQVFTGTAIDMDAAIEEFNTKLEQAGIQKIIDEMQKQVDAFLAEKNK